MPSLLTFVTELENMADEKTEIREYRTSAPEGYYGEIIMLAPNQRRVVTATKFHQRCVDSLRSSVLKIFVAGEDTGRVLRPHDFIDYTRIVFKLDGNRKLVIRGVRDNSFFMSRLQGLRLLMGILGRNHQVMPEEEID